jgi:hypothetical protein
MAPSLGIELSSFDVRSQNELERAIADFARAPNGGVIVAASPALQVRRQQITALMARLCGEKD